MKFGNMTFKALGLFLTAAFFLSIVNPIAAAYESSQPTPIPNMVYQRAECAELKGLTLKETDVNTHASSLKNYDEQTTTVQSNRQVEQPKKLRDYNIKDFEKYKIKNYKLVSVSQVDDRLYLQYTSNKNEGEDQLYLVYCNNVLVEQTSYNSEKDIAVDISGDIVYTEADFKGTAYHDYTTSEGADELALEEAGLLRVSAAAAASTKTNFYPPNNTFPYIVHNVLQTQNKPCSALQNKNVTFKVMENRYFYKKKTADYKAFAVGTTVTLVALYIGGPATVAVKTLTAIGVAISATDTINNAAEIYKKVVYSYLHSWNGYAYDTTSQFCDVLVKRNEKSGEFTFGLDVNNNWIWIRSIVPSNTLTNNAIITQAQSMYNSELMSLSHPGVNMLYFSDLPMS